eukprot:TRINITY_DN6545_c0_g1_i12.p7 TRINITY_DN6545_c0_g1~~TRINITY_DN6545_c0_g1_i12.p7  ORF type:complete len:113 (-),score=5.07 TRINITY_DN6545_c0_g1_i12:539-877(-)
MSSPVTIIDDSIIQNTSSSGSHYLGCHQILKLLDLLQFLVSSKSSLIKSVNALNLCHSCGLCLLMSFSPFLMLSIFIVLVGCCVLLSLSSFFKVFFYLFAHSKKWIKFISNV